MLQESKTNELEYQRLSKEEMAQRGILGRLVGICADFMSPTRNGRKYPEKLWENVFNDPIMKERIDNGVCYGELGHPADREETDMEKIAVCMAEQPKKGSDGKLRAVFDILDTPNGRILKSLCDYGSTLGISSRGSGDLETDFDGQESVNPDTYNCEGFDVVLIPAVKEARLQYVTEALDKKRYNKTLREKLTESIQKETAEHQKVINESLSSLGISLNENFYSENRDKLISKHYQDINNGDIIHVTNGMYDVCLGKVVDKKYDRDDSTYEYDVEVVVPLNSTAKVGTRTNMYRYSDTVSVYTGDISYDYNIEKTLCSKELIDSLKEEFGDKFNYHGEHGGLCKEVCEFIKRKLDAVNILYNVRVFIFKKPFIGLFERTPVASEHTVIEYNNVIYDFTSQQYSDYAGYPDDLKNEVPVIFNYSDLLKAYVADTKYLSTLVIDVGKMPITNESLDSTKLNEEIYLSKDWKTLNIGDDVQWTSHEFDGDTTWDCTVKDVYPDHIIICPKDAKFNDMCLWVDDDMLTESLSLEESALTPEEKMDMWHNGERRENIKACGDSKLYMYRDICKNKDYVREVAIIDNELTNRGLSVPEESSVKYSSARKDIDSTARIAKGIESAKKPTFRMRDGFLYILADSAGEAFLSKYRDDPTDSVTDEIEPGKGMYFVIGKGEPDAEEIANGVLSILDDGYITESLIKAWNLPHTYIDEGWKQLDDVKWKVVDSGYGEKPKPQKNQKSYYVKTDTPKTKMWVLYELNDENVVAEDDGTIVEELQKSLDLNKKLDKKIVDLQEKLSVSYAKEMNLQEELEKYKSKVIKLSRRLAEEKVTNDKLTVIQDKKVVAENTCKQLTESVKTKTAKINSLKESVDKKKEQIVSLNEQVQQLMSTLDERNSQFESLTEKYETLNKDYQQFKENYSKKLEQQHALVEKYRGVAVKSVNKYIDTQATRLGISSEEIKNRLPESYSFTDIDRICEDLQEYKLNISNLPFNTSGRLNEGMRIKATNMNQKTLVPVEDDLDDLTLRLAGLK